MYLVGVACIVMELEPLTSPLAVLGRWMSAYGAPECAVVARKKQDSETNVFQSNCPLQIP